MRPVATGPSARKQAALAKLEAKHAPQPSRFLNEVPVEGPTLGELVAMEEVRLSSRPSHTLLPNYDYEPLIDGQSALSGPRMMTL